MTRTEIATQWMINLANDNSHGYDQTNRWGPDYDCSSSIITAWETAGVPVKTMGATYTGNMRDIFLSCGFSEVYNSVNSFTVKDLVRGDVLLKSGHAAMYIGNGQLVQARFNEFGGETGGQTGAQIGNEITVMGYYDVIYNWTSVLRYTFNGNNIVQAGQIHANNFVGAGLVPDGHRGPATIIAGIKVLQHALNLDYNAGLTVDGSFGPLTQTALDSHYVSYNDTQYLVTAVQILLMLQGYNPNGVESPGHFGEGMLSAVVDFQNAHNLSATGICDIATYLVLLQ